MTYAVKTYPISTVAVAVAVIVQAIFSAMGGTVNFLSALMWAAVLYVFVAERLWKLERLKARSIKAKVTACLAWLVVMIIAGFVPMKELYYRSDEDLRVSFRINTEGQNTLRVTYLFSNLGKQAALVNNIGLFEIVTTEAKGDAGKNYELCDANFETTLLVLLTTGFMGPGAQVGNDTKKSSIYSPKESSSDGSPWSAKEPLSIESGKNKIVSALFELQPNHIANYSVVALCPLIVTLNTAASGRTSICRGISKTVAGTGFVLAQSHEQFRILPHWAGTQCELSGR